MHARNLLILVTTQLISATGSFVFVSLAGIIGAELASDLAWATLPVTVMVLATATTTVPASLLMRRFGRRRGFAMASLSAAVAAFTMTRALAAGSFLLFLTAAALFGINMAFTQQYRYAAAESVDTRHIPLAISFVLLGSIGGAFAGKILAARGEHWVAGIPYAGTMFALIALYVVQAVLFQFYAGVTPGPLFQLIPGALIDQLAWQSISVPLPFSTTSQGSIFIHVKDTNNISGGSADALQLDLLQLVPAP